MAKFKIKHLKECCSLISYFEIEIPVNLRNYLVNKVAVQMAQMGLVAVDLVACTCQEVAGAKKKYAQSGQKLVKLKRFQKGFCPIAFPEIGLLTRKCITYLRYALVN